VTERGIKTFLQGIIAVTCATFLTAASCNPSNPSPHGARPVVTDQGDCAAACANLKYLGCKQANPIDEGTKCQADADCLGPDKKHDQFQTCSALGTCIVTCTNFCIATENQGVWLDPACVKTVKTCGDVDRCPLVTKAGATTCTDASCPLPDAHAH
jgi:hypothetical protein